MGSTPEMQLPALNPEDHRWKQSKTDPLRFERRGVGAECIVGCKRFNPKGQYDLWLHQGLRTQETKTPITVAHLREKLALALYEERFVHPEVGYSVSWDDTNPIVNYKVIESAEEALQWAKDTVHVRLTSKSSKEVWYDIEDERRNLDAKSSKPVDMFIVADVPSEDAVIPAGTKVEIAAHMNHMFWDGIGARTLVGCVLKQLQRFIGTPAGQKPSDLAWGTERDNLCPPPLDSMLVQLDQVGPEFKERCKAFGEALMSAYGGTGIPITKGEGEAGRAEVFNFTKDESKAMYDAMKTRLGSDYTMTHLCQAAVVAAMANLWPEQVKEDTDFIQSTALNGRRFIRDEWKDNHIGFCVSSSLVKIQKIQKLIIGLEPENKDKLSAAMIEAIRDVKKSIDYWVGDPIQMPTTYTFHTYEGGFMATNPLPYAETSAPYLSSDGRNDERIPANITSEATGETIFDVESSDFLLNQFLPYPAFRLESWKGASSINICYNEPNFPRDDMLHFLKIVAQYMLSITL